MAKQTWKRKWEAGRMRHTRAIQRDRTKRPVAAPPDKETERRLSMLLRPAIEAQAETAKSLGLRKRALPLSVMVAAVLSILWRQLGSGGTEVSRLLRTEGLLWVSKLSVTQQAISERLRTFPPILFLNTLLHILPVAEKRWQERQRPLPPVLAWAQKHYTAVLAADGSTLDALLRKVGLLRGKKWHPLAGKMMALLNVSSWLPLTLWFEQDAKVHDQRFWPQILPAVPEGALLLIDLGFTNYDAFAQARHFTFVTRLKSGLSFHVTSVLHKSSQVRDWIGWLGSGKTRQRARVVKVLFEGEWYAFLSNELDPTVLPFPYIVGLYFQRWRIEDAFNIVKRLLGLAYFWTGSQRGILLQIWATWIFYVVLVDLVDDVAQSLRRPFVHLSIEMVYRGLYYFGQAYLRGEATDPVRYLAGNASWLGLVKRRRKRSLCKSYYLTNPSGP
jgi:hypothetical protein